MIEVIIPLAPVLVGFGTDWFFFAQDSTIRKWKSHEKLVNLLTKYFYIILSELVEIILEFLNNHC